MVISEFESSVAALVVEAGDAEVTAVRRVAGVVAAMEALCEAGFTLLLVDPDTEVTVRRVEDRRRRGWRRARKEK